MHTATRLGCSVVVVHDVIVFDKSYGQGALAVSLCTIRLSCIALKFCWSIYKLQSILKEYLVAIWNLLTL